MSHTADAPHKTSRLLDLPLEIFQNILYEAIAARGNERGLRLRLVNRVYTPLPLARLRRSRADLQSKLIIVSTLTCQNIDFFSDQVNYVLFLNNMLDVPLSRAYPQPSFAASYLEHRVNNEPPDGNPRLLCNHQVAEHLSSSPQATKECISSLCSLAAPSAEFIFTECDNYPEQDFESHLRAAEIYMNHLSAVRMWNSPPKRRSRLFGDHTSLAMQYGSQEMVQAVHFEGPRIGHPLRRLDRCRAIWRASGFGRLETFRFSFNYRIEEKPWTFDPKRLYPNEGRYLERALFTPSTEIWDYVMALHEEYGLTPKASQQVIHMSKCARGGWTEMARHLLKNGANPNSSVHEDETPIFYAARHGHIDIVNALLEYGAEIPPLTLAAAAATGHLDTIKLLLSHNAPIGGALVAAAKGGYGDIVEILLESGANANEKDDENPALGYAILQEHTRMFYSLMKYGARPIEWCLREIHERKRATGIESMFVLAEQEQWMVRMNEFKEQWGTSIEMFEPRKDL